MALFFQKDKCEKEGVTFEPMKEKNDFELRNQDNEIKNVSESDILEYIHIMIGDSDQFVVLSAPKAIEDIEFVQAALTNGEIELQVGVKEGRECKLYFKMCTEGECKKAFLDFFHGTFRPDMKEYKPVEFL